MVDKEISFLRWVAAFTAPAALVVLATEGLVLPLSFHKGPHARVDELGVIGSVTAGVVGLAFLWWNLAKLRRREVKIRSEIVVMAAALWGLCFSALFMVSLIVEIRVSSSPIAHQREITLLLSSTQLLVLLAWTVQSVVLAIPVFRSERAAGQGPPSEF